MAHSTSTSHYELSQFASSDKPAWLVDYNGDMEKIDAGIYGAASKAAAAVTNFAPAFNSESTYDVGEYVTYQNVMYKCIAAVTAAGPWNSNQWSATTVSDIAEVVPTGSYADLTNKPSINGIELSGNKTTSDLGITEGNVWEINDSFTSLNAAYNFKDKKVIYTKVGSFVIALIHICIVDQEGETSNVSVPAGDTIIAKIPSAFGIDYKQPLEVFLNDMPATYDKDTANLALKTGAYIDTSGNIVMHDTKSTGTLHVANLDFTGIVILKTV